MKKLSILVLAVCLLVAATSALAIGSATDTDSKDVQGKYVAGGHTDVYSVDVVWGGMQFDYNAATEAWNSETHTWEPTTQASWAIASGSSNTIQVTNHSSVAVNAKLSANMSAQGVTGTFSETSFALAIPSAGANGATTKTVTFMPAGTLAATVTDYTTIGTIVVAID